eukprot:TRINITY_DN1456_c0_g1_i1.p1 TRINITY_DN1456_c0_g1~~TRINITY_DN1456_c0_g1_i1.p1  ORF type:complete len:144 (-),score=43.01 TRINITY_DN1456_c0_g1_i1:41-472(-)
MADGDVVVETKTATGAAEPTGEAMDILSALREVLKKAIIHDGLIKGLRECVKALDRREAHLCVLSSSCDEPSYVRLVEALCKEGKINLLKVPESKQLGEWAGLCKLDKEGNPRKVNSTSVVVVKDYGEPSPALDFLLNHFKTQ